LKKGSSTVAYITGNGAITVPNSTSIATGFSFNGTRGIYCHSGTGDIIFDTNSGANATAVRPLYDNTATATLGTASYRWGGLYVGSANVVLGADVIGQKIVLYSTQTADAFQVLASDGVTVLYKINKDGNPTVKSTVFFEDTNSYIYRTAAQNIMVFAPSSAVTSMQLSTGHLDVLTTYGLRLKLATDSADGEISVANKGGNSGTGLGLLLHGGNGSTSGTPTAGGYIKVYGGDGAAGNTNGGAAYVFGGAKFGSGSDGDVHLGHTGSAMRGKVYLYTMVSPFVTPSSLTSDVNNYAPTLGKNYRLSTDGSNYTITGLSIGQVDGMEITLINTGATGIITISDQDTNSTAANRFLCTSGASIQLDPNERCDLIYDGTTQRWRAF
jgi:hypothetical protein